jgi:proline iminopeptidase
MLLSSSSSSSRRRHRGGAVSARSFSSSLGATTTPGVVDVTKFKQGFINVTRSSDNNGDDGGSSSSTSTHRLCYNIARPMNLSSKQAAPLVVLHGGPSVPSNYLYPLVNVVPYRSIIFYDQLGCGKSDEPTDSTLYSIQNAVTDLKILLNKLNVRRFHLYGQSFGGILAYEYLKSVVACEELEYDEKNDHPQCLSLILSSTPTNVKEVELHVARLIQDLTLSSSSSSEGDKDVNDDDDNINELFRITHQCRLPEMPPLLHEAYANAGSVWRGTSAIADYFAKPPPPTASTSIRKKMPSTLIMRGEYDFVCEESVSQWKTILSSSNTKSVRYKTLQGCSHHGLLEDGMVYGEILDSFCSEYD